MNPKDIAHAKNADLRASQIAIRRDAQQARLTAIQTDTNLIIVKDGKTIRIPAAELRDTVQNSLAPNP
jgi:hypothetical protein